MSRPILRHPTMGRLKVNSARQDPIAEYLATKYGVQQVAPLLLKLYGFIEERGRPTDTDTIDRWLVEEAAGRVGPPRPDLGPGVIYYVRFGDKVKIGTTTNLRQRMASIPHDEILATEPGSYELEKIRHAQFGELRHTKRGEWFRYEGSLIEHVAQLVTATSESA